MNIIKTEIPGCCWLSDML